jgi:hypothetical protein
MRKMPLILAAAAALCALAGNASAGLMGTPPVSDVRSVLAVADVEMTVSNKYGYANLREKPSKSSKFIERLPQGTKVIAIEKVSGGSWIHVKVGDKEGYIQANLLK